MGVKYLVLSVLPFFMAGCGGYSINENRPTTGKIVFLGDSITEGYGVETEERFSSLIEEKLNTDLYASYEVINLGVSGDKVADGLARLETVLEAQPEIVVLALGGNDFLRGTRLETVANDLREILTLLKNRNIDVVLTGVVAPPMKGLGYTGTVKNMYKDLAAEYELVFMPNILKGLVLDQRYMQSDNIHPKAAGHVLIANNLWEYLEPMLRQK
jgi:acyl-CoA thioesterase-1